MAFVQLGGIALAFGARDLIKDATLTLAEGSRAALTGPNGAGKSTLMKIAAGLMKPDAGSIAITKNARISYLPQTNVMLGKGTVLEEAELALQDASLRAPIDGIVVRRLVEILNRHFPAARGARIDHAWCGVLGVPRDWCATVGFDGTTGQ